MRGNGEGVGQEFRECLLCLSGLEGFFKFFESSIEEVLFLVLFGSEDILESSWKLPLLGGLMDFSTFLGSLFARGLG